MLLSPSFPFTQVSWTFIGCPGLPSALRGSLSTQSLAELFSVVYLRVPQPSGWPQRFMKVVKMLGLESDRLSLYQGSATYWLCDLEECVAPL